MALAVALADTFLLRSMVLCAVPTFLAPAFPTRDSLPESRSKITTFLNMGLSFGQEIFKKSEQNLFNPYKARLFGKIKHDFHLIKTYFTA